MKTSTAGQQFIQFWEGLRLKAYQDIGGVWTIGYGHTGPDVTPGLEITQYKAVSLMLQDLSRIEERVSEMLVSTVSQQQFDALISFAYNLGPMALHGSTLLRFLNGGNAAAAALQFIRWDHAGAVEVEALKRRREAEAAIFTNGDYTGRP